VLRAYAFGRCLAKAYDKTPFGEDAERVANAYFHMGKITRADAYGEISKVAESLDAAKPTVMGGYNLAIMACLEFYEGATLKQLVKNSTRGPTGKKRWP
jgi:hypothetical protein